MSDENKSLEDLLRKRELKLLDRRELGFYQGMVTGNQDSELSRRQEEDNGKRYMKNLIKGDRSLLEGFRALAGWKEEAARWDRQRERINGMDKEELIERARKRASPRQIVFGGDRWGDAGNVEVPKVIDEEKKSLLERIKRSVQRFFEGNTNGQERGPGNNGSEITERLTEAPGWATFAEVGRQTGHSQSVDFSPDRRPSEKLIAGETPMSLQAMARTPQQKARLEDAVHWAAVDYDAAHSKNLGGVKPPEGINDRPAEKLITGKTAGLTPEAIHERAEAFRQREIRRIDVEELRAHFPKDSAPEVRMFDATGDKAILAAARSRSGWKDDTAWFDIERARVREMSDAEAMRQSRKQARERKERNRDMGGPGL